MKNTNKTNSKSVTILPAIDLNSPSLQAHLEKGWKVLRRAKRTSFVNRGA